MLLYLWRHRSRPPLFSIAFLKTWAKRMLTFPTLVRTAANRWSLTRRGASIGADSCIGQADIQGKIGFLKVGNASFIGRARLMLHAQIEIGSNVCVNDGVTILTASHDVRDPDWKSFKAPVIIGDFAWLATGAMILPGVQIGRGAVIGAGAVVTRNVPAYAIAAGNPARIREGIRTQKLRYSPVQLLAFQDAWLQPRSLSQRDQPSSGTLPVSER